jgi:DNA (cytosine-5)-methyltransferase 1
MGTNNYSSGIMVPNVDYGKPEFVQRPDGLIIPGHLLDRKEITGIDLFAGCGGMSLGMMQAGVHILAAVDNSVDAAITYTINLGAYPMRFVFLKPEDEQRLEKQLAKAFEQSAKAWQKYMDSGCKGNPPTPPLTTGQGWIHGHHEVPGVDVFFLGDIRKLTGQMILDAVGKKQGEIDIVAGGPPCQGYSTAGKRNVMDPRNSLVFEFARLVLEINPKTMVMENVPGIVSMITPDGIPVLDAFCRILEDGGFGTVDMLKKTLQATSGTGAALRHKPPNNPGNGDDNDEEQEENLVESAQLALF